MSIIGKSRVRSLIYLVVFLSSSCSGHKVKRLDGEIELRNGNEYFIVNKSTSKWFYFTVKETSVSERGDSSFRTEGIRLSPADFMFLGKTEDMWKDSIPVKCKYEITEQKEMRLSN
jgi:hypothetical protein